MAEWNFRLRAKLDDSGNVSKMVVDEALAKDWAKWDAEHEHGGGARGDDEKELSPGEERSERIWGPHADDKGMVDLYHGTAADKVDTIKDEGLKTPSGSGPGWLMVTTSKEQAAEYGKGQSGDKESAVVHFQVPATEARQYLSNPTEHNVYGHDATAAGLTHGELPAKYIVS